MKNKFLLVGFSKTFLKSLRARKYFFKENNFYFHLIIMFSIIFYFLENEKSLYKLAQMTFSEKQK
jgi:hypothetical protein